MFMHVWYRPLIRGEIFAASPSGILVRAIEPEEADLWTLVAFRGGLDSDEAIPNDRVIIAPYPFMAHACCWLAWHHGEPAGAATLAVHDGVAGLFGASTACRIATWGCSMRSSPPGWPRPWTRAAILRLSIPSRAASRSATWSGWGSGWRIPR